MTDPFSIAVGVAGLYTAFKEMYLLGKCVYRACESARASDEERRKLRHDFRFQLVYAQSFGQYYLKNKKIADDIGLDTVSNENIALCEPFKANRRFEALAHDHMWYL
jgi:hypothetical protein